jgi:hypothetical protein
MLLLSLGDAHAWVAFLAFAASWQLQLRRAVVFPGKLHFEDAEL